MASGDGFDLYTCEVCFENMLDKNPRLLSCHHSFCFDCLRQQLKRSTIICPTCREKTAVPYNDLQTLKANFMIQKFKAQIDKLYSSRTLLCQLCLSETATLKCQECVQVLCEDCIYKHNKIKQFRRHKIYKFCLKHKEGMISHVCVRCALPACAKCVITEHSEHENDVETYEEGIGKLCEKLNGCETKLDVLIQAYNPWEEKKHQQKKLETVTQAISNVEGIKKHYLEKIQEADTTLEQLSRFKAKIGEYKDNREENSKEWKSAKGSIQKVANEIRSGHFGSFNALMDRIDRLITDENSKVTYTPPDTRIEDPISGHKLNLTKFCKTNRYLKEPFLVHIVHPGEKSVWKTPWNISCISEDGVIVSDWDTNDFRIIFGSNTDMINLSFCPGNGRDACVYQEHLYTAHMVPGESTDCIIRRPFINYEVDNEEIQHLEFSEHIRDISSIAVFNDSCIYILSRSEKRIVEFNHNIPFMKNVVTDLQGARYLSLLERDKRTWFLVSCSYSIRVYDDKWQLVLSIGEKGTEDGQLLNPAGTTNTSEGILVADQLNQRISQFSFEGKFMKHILTSHHGLGRPIGLAFNNPFLWVSQWNPIAVKCFKICD